MKIVGFWWSEPWLCFYQTRSAWSMDQGSVRKRSAVHNFAPTVTKFYLMWEGLSLPHDTKFGNCRGDIVDRRIIFCLILDQWIRLIWFDQSRARIIGVSQAKPLPEPMMTVNFTHCNKVYGIFNETEMHATKLQDSWLNHYEKTCTYTRG